MEKQNMIDKAGLEKDLKKLKLGLSKINKTELIDKIIIDIHGPGWTTPAEFWLFRKLMQESLSQITKLNESLQNLEQGNMAIKGELNF